MTAPLTGNKNIETLDAQMKDCLGYVSPHSSPLHTSPVLTTNPTTQDPPKPPITSLAPNHDRYHEDPLTNPPSAFESHPQFPHHPTIFFIYDFVRNTHNQLKAVDPAKFYAGDKASRDAVQEIIGRNGFAEMLTGDTTGKLAMLTRADPANPVDFGEDVKAKAKIMAGSD